MNNIGKGPAGAKIFSLRTGLFVKLDNEIIIMYNIFLLFRANESR